ncbi:MAG: hypothetical protein DMG65_19380 [Candidatus Angelobacter sp. Gp1-AA117]|nr:MAG: hypothetical protein DMG65_19380 [Candidatus Angelobacter sp. Gp1-AA117]
MPLTLINPMNETVIRAAAPPARLQTLAGKKIGLLDISKPGGSLFLDRLEKILLEQFQVSEVSRTRKPTFTKNRSRAGQRPGASRLRCRVCAASHSGPDTRTDLRAC